MDKLITINGIGPDNYFNFSHSGYRYEYDKVDDEGNIVYELDDEGNQKLDYSGNPIPVKQTLVSTNHHHINGTPSVNGSWDGAYDTTGPEGLITAGAIRLPYTHITCYDYDYEGEGILKTMGVSDLRRYVWKFAPTNHNHTGEYLENIAGAYNDVTFNLTGVTSTTDTVTNTITLSSTTINPGGLTTTGYVNNNTNRTDAMTVTAVDQAYSGSEFSEQLVFTSETSNI